MKLLTKILLMASFLVFAKSCKKIERDFPQAVMEKLAAMEKINILLIGQVTGDTIIMQTTPFIFSYKEYKFSNIKYQNVKIAQKFKDRLTYLTEFNMTGRDEFDVGFVSTSEYSTGLEFINFHYNNSFKSSYPFYFLFSEEAVINNQTVKGIFKIVDSLGNLLLTYSPTIGIIQYNDYEDNYIRCFECN